MPECKKLVSATQLPEQTEWMVAGFVSDWASAEITIEIMARQEKTAGIANLVKMDFSRISHPPELDKAVQWICDEFNLLFVVPGLH